MITERDFESEYLFRMCSTVTELATSPEVRPIRPATMLCHFAWTRKGYVATRFILFSCTAESSATSGYAVVTERFSQSEARASKKAKRTRKNFSFVHSIGFNRCSR